VGWGAQEEDVGGSRKKSNVESSTERKEIKNATKRGNQSSSASGLPGATSLGPAKAKKRRFDEKIESSKRNDQIRAPDRIANDCEGEFEAIDGDSVAESDEDSTTKDVETETSAGEAAASTDEDGSAIVAFTPPGSEIVIIGMATVTVLEGKVEIMGCTISCMDESPSVQICSPDGGWASSFTIVDVSYAEVTGDEPILVPTTGARIRIDSLSWNGPSADAASVASKTFHITQRTDVRSALIIAARWRSTADVVISDLKQPLDAEKKDEDQLPDPSRVLVCGAKGVGKSTYVRYLLNKVISCSQSGDNSARKRRRVAVLDCDVGQPELGAPGLITLTVLEKPLLSPPHVHMVCGEEDEGEGDGDGGHPCFSPSSGHASARFFGHISAKADPLSYTAAIASLMRKYEELIDNEVERESAAGEGDHLTRLEALPLLVNTAGWVKGMGFEILSTIVDVVRPGHIVQIVGAARAKFFDLTPHALKGRSIHVVEAFGSVSRLPTDQDTTPSPSRAVSPVPPSAEVTKKNEINGETMQPTAGHMNAPGSIASASTGSLRTLRLSSYFLGGYKHLLDSGAKFWPASCGIYDPHCYVASTLATMRPYYVPFHSVFCFVPSLMEYRGTAQADELIMKSLNGSIVGLCYWSRAAQTQDYNSQHGITIQATPPHLNTSLLPCMGLGIVRGIDKVRQCFYILTPIAPEKLNESPPNVLVRGLLQLPLTCTYRGVDSESLQHLNCDNICSGTGDEIMKSKNAPAKPPAR